MKHVLLAALLLASCNKPGSPDIQISNAWARETVAGQAATAAYMTLGNQGTGDDRLIAIGAPAPATAMLHASESSEGIARMRPMQAGLAIPAGATVEFKPGGSHVMITGLGGPLRAGDTLKLALRFEKSGERPIDVRIASAAGPEGH